MSDIELRITQAWADYHSNNTIKPDFLCLSAQDRYTLSKALNSDDLVKEWRGIKILAPLTDSSEIFFLRK